ncbi:MAG TPA: branched-chain amino acid ABC transporter permease [Candidatus Cybelea sp.]|nr:branched-chain amino acid ABC transporter permease [Candidatus Cybelea sp.]
MAAADSAVTFLTERHRWHWSEALPWIVAVGCFFVFPGYLAFGAQILIAILFALSLDLILGYAGIVTLGHAAFFGAGAYTAGLLAARLGWSEPLSCLVLGAVAAAALGFVSGWFLLRYAGLTLLMLTLAAAVLLSEFANAQADITGGFDGVTGIEMWPLFGVFNYDLYGHTNYVYALATLFAVFLAARRIVHSPFGQALIGIRENTNRMRAIGSPVHRRLVTVYTISAGMAGIAGALFAETNAFVTLDVLSFQRSAAVLVMLIFGGTGRLYGAFFGAAIYMLLEHNLAKLNPQFWEFGLGAALVLTVLFARRGLLGLVEDFGARFRSAPS